MQINNSKSFKYHVIMYEIASMAFMPLQNSKFFKIMDFLSVQILWTNNCMKLPKLCTFISAQTLWIDIRNIIKS